MSLNDNLSLAFKSRFSLIYIQTQEEERLLKDINTLCTKIGVEYLIWNFAREDKDPLSYLIQHANKHKAIFVLQDAHTFLNDPGALGNKFRRYLRNLPEEWKNQENVVILTAPVMKIHDDIKRDFLVIIDKLPDYIAIAELINGFLQRNNLLNSLSELMVERICSACLGLTGRQINRVLAKAIYSFQRVDESCIDLIIEEKKNIIQQSGILEFFHSKDTIEQIGGLDDLKNWLKQRRSAFTLKARNYGLPTPKGLLILGIQGTGKSLTAKAVSSLWHLPLLRLDIGKVFGSLVGESESKIREALSYAEAISPCILWMDELDKAFSGMSGMQGDSGTSARVFGTFLTWMQEKEKPVFVVATANDIANLPPEMLRKGRFDEIFFVDLPDKNELKEIYRIHIEKTQRDSHEYNLNQLVKASIGFTGAEIEQAIIDAMYNAYERDDEYTTNDIVAAIKNTIPISVLMKERIEELRQWARGRARFASVNDQKLEANKPEVIL
jgi:ATP-dependent 26S proteasome regulatory subunit